MIKNVLVLIAALLAFSEVTAQSNKILHLDRTVYNSIKNLQSRGFLPELNPTKLPYKTGEIRNALSKIDKETLNKNELFWYNRISAEVGSNSNDNGEILTQVDFDAGFNLNNTLALNGIRAKSDQAFFSPDGSLIGYMEKDNFAAQMGISHDLWYEQQKDLQDPLSRYYVRNEDFYLGYNGDFLNVYTGRFQNQWAPYNQLSASITDNAFAFDQINITVGNSWFNVSSIVGELDNLDTDGTFQGVSTKNGTRRYLALHRIDVKLTDNIRLGYFDGFLYSGDNARLSLDYFNPMNFFFFDRNSNPENNEYNAFFGGLAWMNFGKFTFHSQLMIDDFQTPKDRTTIYEPITLSVINSLNVNNVLPSLDLGFELELIGYQTYNTDQAEGRYLYLERGIATQYNDYGLLKLYGRYHAHAFVPGLTITPTWEYLAQGEQEIDQDFVREYPNGDALELFITGIPEYTNRFSINFDYDPNPLFWLEIDLGYNIGENENHIRANDSSRFTFIVETGIRVTADQIRNLF